MCLFLERRAKNTVDYNWLFHREMVGLLLLRGSLESMVSWVVMETIVFCLSRDWCCRVEQVYAISVFFNTFSLLSFSASSLKHECSCFTPIVIFPIPLILSMTVSPPSVFPCVSLMIYWFIDVAIQCKLLYWLSTNKGRKTHVSELRARSSHASSLWSQIQIGQQHVHAPAAVFSLEQKVTKSQMKGVSSVWMCYLASRSLSGLISQSSVYIDIKQQWS